MTAKKQGRRTAEQAKLTKIKILTNATILFCDHGYQQVSLRDISEKAGVSHSLIRHYFGAKHQIWEEILHASHNYMTRYMIELQKVTNQPNDAKGSLYHFTVSLMAFVIKRPRLFQIIFACVQLIDPIKDLPEEERERNIAHLDLIFNAYEIYEGSGLSFSDQQIAEIKWNFLNFVSTPILIQPLMFKLLGGSLEEGLLTHWKLYEAHMSRELNIDEEARIKPNKLEDTIHEFSIMDTDVEAYLKRYCEEHNIV